ncbi:MAG TPA: NADP-dependent oxidoreductase [Devosia sp.]|nr:NADP-dependent oxidoreductase [Devosia sp.]
MAQMQAVRMHEFGGPKVLHAEIVGRPEPGADELLVRIHAASINPVDYKMRSGNYPTTEERDLPLTLGRDLSGVVMIAGAEVADLREGDAVFAFLGPGRGSYGEYAIVKREEAAPKPANINHAEAAAVPLAGLTAWQGLFDHGQLRAGQRVLIHGGAGGVGHFAVQFAKNHGAMVFTTASGQDAEFLHRIGADQVIDYKKERFEDVANDIDLVFDLIGGETEERSWAVIRKGGTLVSTLGEPSQDKAGQHDVRGVGYKTQPNSNQLAQIGRLIEEDRLHPNIAATFRLSDAGSAQDWLEHEHIQGKIVLDAAS